MKVAAKALTPIQHLYEEAWVRTVASVQHEMSRMHAELMKLLDAERKQALMLRVERDAAFEHGSRLRAEHAEMKDNLNRAAVEIQRMNREREDQGIECRRLQADNEVLQLLQRQGQAQMLRAQAGEQAQKDAMTSTVETMRAKVAKQFEVEMAVKLKDLQEQQSLRIQAEKKLADATRQLKGVNNHAVTTSQ
jgi:hypothetical protein